MNLAFFLITPYISTLLLFYFLTQLLPARTRFWKIALYLLPLALTHLPKYLLGSFSPVSQAVSVLAVVLMCVYALLLFGGPRWKRVGFTLTFYALQLLVDTVCYGIVQPAWGADTAEYTLAQMMGYMAVAWSLYILVGAFCVLLSRMLSMRRFEPFHALFMIFPVSQIILVYCSIFNILNIFWVLGVVLGLGAEIALLGYTVSQEKKMELEEELNETRHMLELEHAHYRAVEEQQEEMARIRHDFNNQLATIGQLVRQGEETDAQRMIGRLSEEMGKTKANPYCGIPVVNAILTEKAQTCGENGLGLTVELDIPRELAVEPMHLCSIFSNLLDNAIRGAKASGEANPVIRLSSMAEGDYLFIKMENPAPPPGKRTEKGHGYGLRILRDIAAQYGGAYQGEYQDGGFTAVVTLQLA